MSLSCSFCVAIGVLGLFIIYKVVDRLLRLPWVGRYGERYVFITGCDTGFGHDLAKRLDSRGCHVFAACLTEKGETELRKLCSDRLQTIQLDVSKPESVRKAFQIVKERLEKDGKDLWAVVNNAGILCAVAPLEWQTLDDYRDMAAVNLYGLIDVTMTFLPLVKKSRGRVVNTASVFGRHVIGGCPQYCVSKFRVEAFTDGLRRALRGFDCKAILIEPGLHGTNIISKESVERQLTESWQRAPAEAKEEYGEDFFKKTRDRAYEKNCRVSSTRISDVIDAYEHALLGRFPRVRYVVGSDARFLWLPLQALPEWLGDWLIEQLDRGKPVPAVLQKLQ